MDAVRLHCLLLVERRQLRTVIGDEDGEQARRSGDARILAEVLAYRRLEEGFSGLIGLDGSRRRVLRADRSRQT
jgi:hypothetical protein